MQYGHGNSKYVVIFDPLPTGHVTRGMHREIFGILHGLMLLWGFISH